MKEINPSSHVQDASGADRPWENACAHSITNCTRTHNWPSACFENIQRLEGQGRAPKEQRNKYKRCIPLVALTRCKRSAFSWPSSQKSIC